MMKTEISNRENKQEMKNVQRMTSLEIAEVAGKQHKDVMRAIRNMEPAWEKVQGRKFALSSRTYELPNGGRKEVPCYELTKTECLYIATKFNDEARARLVLRWEELELAERKRQMAAMQTASPLIDLSGSRGSQASIVVLMGADGKALQLTPEVMQRLMAPEVVQQLMTPEVVQRLMTAGGKLLPVLTGLLPVLTGLLSVPAERHPYHGPVRKLVARTAHGIVREGTDDYTLYIRIPSKAYLEALAVSKETFFEAEFRKLMMQCATKQEHE